MNITSAALLATTLALLTPLDAHAQLQSCDMGAPHPDAPAAAADFDFLVGNWEVKSRIPAETESGWSEGFRLAYWEGRYMLNGFGIVDYWYDSAPGIADGTTGRGVNTRVYDPQNDVWHMAWLYTGQPFVLRLQARRDGEVVRMWQLNEDGTRFEGRRTTFHDITETSWKRTDERTNDGVTWRKTLLLEATAVACPYGG